MVTPFETAFARLNPAQKQAVETIEGPVMVIAGPGTGKTQVLTIRIAHILKTTDISPSSILALTFTESAAHNMRQRLLQFIGEAAYQVRIETFHAFCDDVIRSHPEYFSVRLNSQPLGDIEKFQLMEHLLDTLPLTSLRTVGSSSHYLSAILKAFSDLKREGITPTKYAELVEAEQQLFEQEKDSLKKTALTKREKELARMVEVGAVFEAYQQQLLQRRRYDYDDMIRYVVEAFQAHEVLLAEYQEKFLYFLIDEYQDTNASQNKVVGQLASYWGPQANICVVGDPHQSIYRFQGASLENTLTFLDHYPDAELVYLDKGYRCPQPIYTAAAAVIAKNPSIKGAAANTDIPFEYVEELSKKLELPLESQTTSIAQPIVVTPLSTQQEEYLYVTKQVQQLLAQGVPAHEIAVLYRNNADGEELQEIFTKHQISVTIERTQNVLDHYFIQQILRLMETLDRLREGQEMSELAELMLAPWWALDRLHVLQLLRAAGKTRMSFYDRVKSGHPELTKLQDTKQLTPLELAPFEDVLGRLERWAVEEVQQPFVLWFEQVLQESGVVNWLIKQPDKVILLEHLRAFMEFIRQQCAAQPAFHLDDLLRTLVVMEEHALPVALESTLMTQDGVKFSTVHKAKGQEWQHVFLIKCIDGKWGNARAGRSLPLPSGILELEDREVEDKLEDDRRLFYVALTRAKQQITVTYPQQVVSGSGVKEVLGSVFIAELPDELKTCEDAKFSQDELTAFTQRTLHPADASHWGERERAWLQEVVADFSLSVSALNTYLRSPEEFFRKYILKLPMPMTSHQVFGTAVHSALEYLYRVWKDEKMLPSEKDVIARFVDRLNDQYLDRNEYERRREHGRSILHQYMSMKPITQTQPLYIEKFFGYGVSTTMLGDIRLNGQIDRVDLMDPEQKIVQLVDYKTGSSRTQNEILAKVGTAEYSERELALPEAVRGVYKRQLLFYKLLLQLDRSFQGKVSSGVFEYVEPEDSGKYVTREIPLLDEDVEELKKLIAEVMAEIRMLLFLPSEE